MRYDVERSAVLLSVGELCELALRAGDLDLRAGKGRRSSSERALLGTRIHQRLQTERGARYAAEVPLTNTMLLEDLCYEVSGRADGILAGEIPTVEEIKTVGPRAFRMPPLAGDEAQLFCYAYFLCRERGLQEVRTRLTYYNTESEELRSFDRVCSAGELREFYLSLLSRISWRARLLRERAIERLPSAKDGKFPYASVREGQDLLIRECYRDIRAGKRLFAEAPTGIGKTLSTLYPAVRAMGDGACEKIFYLTAKASTRREAYRAAEQIFRAGAHLRTVVLTAREQLCRNEAARRDPCGITGHCNPLDCPFAQGFFDRCEPALQKALDGRNGFPRTAVLQAAEEFGICPYELQLMLAELCDIIICDYNYVFDPHVYLRRFFGGDARDLGNYVFLIDEAHNLGDRACAMYSAELCNEEIARAWRMLPEEDPLRKPLEELAVEMHGLRRLCRDNLFRDGDGVERGYYISRNPMEQIGKRISGVRGTIERALFLGKAGEVTPLLERLSTAMRHYETVAEYYDESFLTFLEVRGDTRILRQICLDPSKVLDVCLSRARAAVLFSATLTPQDYFADILGGGKDASRLSLPSPFPKEHFCPVAVTSVSTRFEDREKSYKKICALIAATVSAKAGNYMVYFPSYRYMEEILRVFKERYPKVSTVVQKREMSQGEKERFLDAFRDDEKLRIGFCVLGGSFSEGVDLPGRRLIGTVIVGTGMPGISNERNILKEYYDTTRERGFDYAYVYPGMNRVLQAAGRVIRREEDRGVVVLIDDRYGDALRASLLPDHWSHLQYAGNPSELAEIVTEFWHETEKNG